MTTLSWGCRPLTPELKQLYADGKREEILAGVDDCLPRDGAGGLVAKRERSDVVHDLQAFLECWEGATPHRPALPVSERSNHLFS